MRLSANLQLRQSQSMAMTPQLIQSIKLLQLTHLELLRFIEEEVERNPLVQIVSNDEINEAADGDTRREERLAAPAGDDAGWAERGLTSEGETTAERMDTSYDNVFPDDAAGGGPPSAGTISWKRLSGPTGEANDLDRFAATNTSLSAHVGEQIALTFRNPAERMIAAAIAEFLDEAGYLDLDTGALSQDLDVAPGMVEAVLATLQTFDPPGLFARSLKECLALQLRRLDQFDPAMETLVDHLDLLARRDFATLGRLCSVDSDDLLDMLAEIRALSPKPGMAFSSMPVETVVPDILVTAAAGGGWHVEMNAQVLPRVLVDRTYYQRIAGHKATRGEDRAFLSDCLASANWLTRSLDQRARTITTVASEIVRRQDGFLMHGPTHLRPLNLRTVAEAVGMHESTISRVTSNKYMMTPRGLFELRYFFTVPIAATGGAEAHSAEAVRQAVRTLIARETADSILSDDEIVKLLKEDGIDIARRTVAKYRESMNIASSVQRRREKRALSNRALTAGVC